MATEKNNVIKGYKTVSLKMCSWHDPSYKFEVGKTYSVGSNVANDGVACGTGLHFCQHKKDILSYCRNKNEYILLQVEANKSDILGQDESKTRVRKLKIVKVLEKVERWSPEVKQALKKIELANLDKKFLQPNKAATSQKVTALSKKIMSVFGGKSVYMFDNLYELYYYMHVANGADRDYISDLMTLQDCYKGDAEGLFKMPSFKMIKHADSYINVDEVAGLIVGHYADSLDGKNPDYDKKSREAHAAMFELLTIGCLPLGTMNGQFLVFVPKTNPFKKKK